MNAEDRKTLLLGAAIIGDYARSLREGHTDLRTGRWPKNEQKIREQYEIQLLVAAQLRLIAHHRT